MEDLMEGLKSYIIDWNKEDGVKPKNNPKFIRDFLKFAKSADFDHWEFDGINGYCGYTAILHEQPHYSSVYGLGFEFAYDKDFVKVFTDRHNGYWTPEYIDLKGEDAQELLIVVKDKLNGWAGFDS